MSGHQEFLALLVVRDELPAEQRGRLERHLAGCAPCRDAAALYAINRLRLRGLPPAAPPRDLRRQLLDSADRTAEVIGLYAPFVVAFCILPLSMVAAAVVLIYGLLAWLALFAAIGLFAYLTARRYPQAADIPAPEPTTQQLRRLLRALSVDAAGIVAAAAALSLAVALLALVQQGRAAFGG